MKRPPKPLIIHHCPTCKRLSAIANDEPKNCLWCGEKAVEVGQELPFDMEDKSITKDPADQYNEANPIIFVYQKDGNTKALSFHEAKEQAKEIEADGWAHVATLDAKVFVENSYREADEAQSRHDTAMAYINSESEFWYDSKDRSFYPEDTPIIKQALKIAAGLKID